MLKAKKKEIPVYVFVGFLEAGKTDFMQGVLEGNDFCRGERTLLLVCEEGENEYNPKKFSAPNIFIETIDSESELNPENLQKLTDKYMAEQVLVEYNGMWMMKSFYEAMPQRWMIYQILMVVDATTFMMYNKNMRNLMYDKLNAMEMIVFNRFTDDMSKDEFHKIVRAANRSADIIYEFGDDRIELDDIEDPLPFDINADVIEIRDVDYALWYRDINEEPQKYEGKTVSVKGRCLVGNDLPSSVFIFGRHVMTCCVEDIQFAGLIGTYPECEKKLKHGEWYKLTGRISVGYHPVYGEEGPILNVKEYKKAAPPVEEVATFS